MTDQITPSYIEDLITRTGRDEVFARANALGWSGQIPPLFVWNVICQDIQRERQEKGDVNSVDSGEN